MRRMRSSSGMVAVLSLTLALLVVAASAAPAVARAPLAAGATKYSTIASLEDGPSEIAAKQAEAAAAGVPAAGWEQSFLQQQSLRAPRYTEQQRLEHLAAAQAAHAYAAQYVKQHQMTQQKQQKQAPKPKQRAPAGPNAPNPKFAASTYELIARAQQVARDAALRRKQEAAAAGQQQPSDTFDFADAGAFIEEGVQLKHAAAGKGKGKGQGRGRAHGRAKARTHAKAHARGKAHAHAGAPFEKQEWTYSDTAAPPAWLQASTDGLQGLPTTKPPPVPRMPPPPPPQPTPTWMSPFDEHQTPVFPQSSTPAPFYGMGPAPPGPPANYLPLDAFLSPAPEGEGAAGAAPAEEAAPAEF